MKNSITTIGVIGCGNILPAYMNGLARFGKKVQVVHLADMDVPRATKAAEQFNIPKSGKPEGLLGDSGVDVVVNLTPPVAHAQVTKAVVDAGKHVYSEKPLARNLSEASEMLAHVGKSRRLLGSAPDTFLGSGGQTARAVLDSGEIGDPIGFTAFCTYSRAERWHPNPGFLFQPGAGPVLDVGGYYVAALINLFGPLAQVAGKTRIGIAPRRVKKPDGTQLEIPVAVPTHANALLSFRSGVIGTFVASFDIWDNQLPHIEVYGMKGTLSMPHPNFFDGDVKVRLHDDKDWRVITPVARALEGDGWKRGKMLRGLGVVDLAEAAKGSAHRTNAATAFHTLEVLESIQASSETSQIISIKSTCERPNVLTAETLESWVNN